jgi:4-hydroxy-4-methyl-2-oxoglutarate aldolase
MAKGKTAGRPGAATLLAKRLRRLSSETVSDVLDVMGLTNQVLAAALQPLRPGMRLAGPAFCVRGQAIDASRPVPADVAFEVERRVTPGCIVMTATGGWRGSAVIDGHIALAYRKKGCAGFVVDGGMRYATEIRTLGLPGFATHVTPLRSTNRWSAVEFGQAIAMPGQNGAAVVIHPGDLILGDDAGVISIPGAVAADVIAATEKLVRLEKRAFADIKRGMDREAALKRTDRHGHIRKLIQG